MTLLNDVKPEGGRQAKQAQQALLCWLLLGEAYLTMMMMGSAPGFHAIILFGYLHDVLLCSSPAPRHPSPVAVSTDGVDDFFFRVANNSA